MSRHSASLRDIDRNAYGERVTRQQAAPSLGAAINRIMSQPQTRKDATVNSPTEGLHTAALTRQRITQLAADGVTQLTRADLKGMRPEQIEQARRDGKLLELMSASDSA